MGSFADTLQEMDGFVMIDNEKCNLNVVYNGVIKDHMLCADGGAVDTCEGVLFLVYIPVLVADIRVTQISVGL